MFTSPRISKKKEAFAALAAPRMRESRPAAPERFGEGGPDYYTTNCLVLFGAIFADIPQYSTKAAHFCFGNMPAARRLDSQG
jgi:hypothetical protein